MDNADLMLKTAEDIYIRKAIQIGKRKQLRVYLVAQRLSPEQTQTLHQTPGETEGKNAFKSTLTTRQVDGTSISPILKNPAHTETALCHCRHPLAD